MGTGPRFGTIGMAGVALAALTSLACGDDGNGAMPDASAIDASVADAGPCGADFYYQAEVLDWSTGLSAPGSATPAPTVTMTEIGNESNTTSVAPNGRAVLCLPADSVSQLSLVSSVHLPHIEVVDPELASTANPIYLLTQADLDGLATGEQSVDKGHVLINVVGEAVTVDAFLGVNSDPAVVGIPGSSFSPGASVEASGSDWIVFRNADVGSAELILSGGACSFPATVPIVGATTTGVTAACYLGP